MIRNYLKTTIRFVRRSAMFSFINIFGLAIGISCSLLILLYVNREISFDRFHTNIDNLYRLRVNLVIQGKENLGAISSPVMGPELAATFPEIRSQVRLLDLGGMVEHEEKVIRDIGGFFADTNFFEIFSFHLLQGDPADVLSRPGSVVITRSLAGKIFGEENPMGKTISWNHLANCTVTGVVEDPPDEGHLDFDLIMPIHDYFRLFNPYKSWDGGYSYYTYLLLEEEASPDTLEKKFIPLMYEKINRDYEQYGARIDLSLFPVKKIRLFADYDYELGRTGTLTRTLIFSGIAILILLIAGFNYINLTTARSSQRAREIGIRKATGATRGKLIRQFTTETLSMTFLAGILSLIMVEMLLPSFNRLTGTDIHLYQITPWKLLLGYPLLLIVVGGISSLYPAVRLSGMDPIRSLRGMTESSTGKPVLRNALVIIQYVISVALIIATAFIYLQLDYLQKKDPGYDRENILVIPMINAEMQQKAELLRNSLSGIPQVRAAGMGSGVPGYGLTMNGYQPEGYEKSMMFHALDIDPSYISTLGLKIRKGRNFSEERAGDRYAMLVNETLVKELGWNDPLGKTIFRDTTYTIIGVVEDFHYSPVQQKINPLVITLNPSNRRANVLVKLGNTHPETIRKVEATFDDIFPATTFYGRFLEDSLSQMFETEKKFAQTVLVATILAIFLASMGLFALSLFATERRTREIGVRKAMGANSLSIALLFIREFTARILLANLLAYPLVWYALNQWLQNYPYRIGLNPLVFIAGTLLSFLLTLLTVSFQALKSARTNPAEVLKYE
ncbi:MAG: ABC transporter permease [Bacteroidales bacterium]